MKKHLLSVIITGSAIFSIQNSFAQPTSNPRGCLAAEYKKWEEEMNPALKVQRTQMETVIRNYIQTQSLNPKPASQVVLTIPVVFHVIYKTSTENLSDQIIKDAVDRLNKDYRKLNTDLNATTCPPQAWRNLAADCEIQFVLASEDPNGSPTTGIVHKPTSLDGFQAQVSPTAYDDRMKFNAQGGDDVWDNQQYINFWIVKFTDNTLGRGSFPGTAANIDGIVMSYKTLAGAPGPGIDPRYNLSRTLTHELGHYFGLAHTWGDDGNTDGSCNDGQYQCAGSDLVDDTPNQCDNHINKPTFPQMDACSNCTATSCTVTITGTTYNGGAGDPANGTMYMNYMDYTDDDHIVMFTLGQKTRMLAIIDQYRPYLKTISVTGTANTRALNQLVSVYPNPSTGDIFISGSIPNATSADIMVYNTIGGVVLTKKVALDGAENVKLDINDQPEGMYFIQLKTTEGTIVKKAVINR